MDKAKITISRPSCSDGSEYIIITVDDRDAGIQFLELNLSYDAFTKALTGLAYVECDMDFRGLENVGKKIEHGKIEFTMPSCDYKERLNVARFESQFHTPEGWEASTYFGSQDSFFIKDGQDYARTSISRWIDKP